MSANDLLERLQSGNYRTESRRYASADILSAITQGAASQGMAGAAGRRLGGGGSVRGLGGAPNYNTGPIRGRVPRPKHLRPHAPIVSIKDFQGHTVQVNKSVAKNFRGFLRALKRRGYKINSIGGYADRNIAGTSTPSLHSYGFAIDINPQANPVTYGRRKTNMPRGVGRMARRFGLEWGGNWNGSKKDTMHFSVPFRGTK